MFFKDRIHAGKLLAERLQEYKNRDALVLGIPRGGVVVAAEVAKALRGELDVIVTKKIGAPGNPEFAIGAIDSQGHLVLNEDVASLIDRYGEFLEVEKRKVIEKVKDYERKFRGERPPLKINGRIVIITDDGTATGSTILPAIASVKEEDPLKIVVALPVGPPGTIERLKRQVDQLVVLDTPAFFMSVGQFYEDFEQTSDEEVREILEESTKSQAPNHKQISNSKLQ